MDLFNRSTAVLSQCQLYRYKLTRIWDESLPLVCWLMLNPSTADANTDDPTIRRCIGFAHSWGMGGIVVVNLFAWRASFPSELLTVTDPVGPDNDQAIIDAVAGNFTVVAWGSGVAKKLRPRIGMVLNLVQSNALSIDCLGVTKNGAPRHPLYVPSSQKLEPWREYAKVQAKP